MATDDGLAPLIDITHPVIAVRRGREFDVPRLPFEFEVPGFMINPPVLEILSTVVLRA
jgi:hypothetical protein